MDDVKSFKFIIPNQIKAAGKGKSLGQVDGQMLQYFVCNLNWMNSSVGVQPMRMIDFVSGLYERYRVLNKLSEKQSLDFQREVVTMLVDPKENVNPELYATAVQQQGEERFVLDLLAKAVNRTPLKNQFELNRNLATIADSIKKEQDELQKRQKVLDRREEKLRTTEESLLAAVKQKMQAFENQALQRIAKKEGEVKKAITQLLNQLKAKEKLITERYEESKANAKLLAQIEQKERAITEKMKIVEKKEREVRERGNDNEGMKRESELQQYREQVEKLKDSQREAVKRYKNLELAYKKLKNDKARQQPEKIETIPKLPLPTRAKEVNLDDLDLSGIHQKDKPNSCEEFMQLIDFEETSGKLESIKKLLGKPQAKGESQLKEIKQVLNIHSPGSEIVQISPYQSEEEESSTEERMPVCLQPIAEESSLESALRKIKAVSLEEEHEKLAFMRSGALESFIDQCYSLNIPHQLCEALLEKILELIEESAHYLEIIAWLAGQRVVDFLQRIYLSHETNPDIVETATLILSRIKLKDFQLHLSSQFAKALQIRLKVEPRGSFLYGNIHFILT